MTSAVFASLHIYYAHDVTEVADDPLPQLQKSSYVPAHDVAVG